MQDCTQLHKYTFSSSSPYLKKNSRIDFYKFDNIKCGNIFTMNALSNIV